MSTPPISYTGPTISSEVPFEVRRHLQLIYQKLGNHTQAFALQQAKINTLKAGVSNTIVEGGGTGGGGSVTPFTPNIFAVNDQSSATAYSTVSGDDGALIVLSDASPIAISLTPQTPPFGCFFANQGAGTATLTPEAIGASTPTISYTGNPGAASMPLLSGYGCLVGFDGANWFALTMPIVPLNAPAIAHEWIDAYNSSTGLFSQTQPDYSDLTGTPTLPATIAPVSGEYLTGYNAATGLFSQSTPAGISVTITTAALTSLGTQGSMTFTNGILTAQTPAT